MNKYFAELVGTFVLVFGGVGSAVLAGSHIGFAGISAAFGLSLLAMVYTIGPISGCHVNPAVTLGSLSRSQDQCPRCRRLHGGASHRRHHRFGSHPDHRQRSSRRLQRLGQRAGCRWLRLALSGPLLTGCRLCR